jgi:hypothetical protein
MIVAAASVTTVLSDVSAVPDLDTSQEPKRFAERTTSIVDAIRRLTKGSRG